MITIFNRRELCSVYSMSEQVIIRETLSKNKIDYYIRTINHTSKRGTRSSFGINMKSAYQYIFYVRKRDYDMAKHAINR